MKALSTSEEQVMAALWACGKPATRRQIAAKLPPDCVWADSTLLNFLLRLEAKGYVRPEKEGNKNIYKCPLLRHQCGDRIGLVGGIAAQRRDRSAVPQSFAAGTLFSGRGSPCTGRHLLR